MIFSISKWGQRLSGHYPRDAFDPNRINENPSREDIRRFVSLWLTEGIPFAFQDQPMRYELIRERVASNLEVEPRDVSMVGSARIGFSFAPGKFGRPYDPTESDLDIFVVSNRIFNELKNDFDFWLGEWKRGNLDATKLNKRWWDENVQVVTRTTTRGFIDANKIPPLRQCPTVRGCMMTAEMLRNALKKLPDWPSPRTTTMRVYADWGAAIQQNYVNISASLKKAGIIRPLPS